MFQTHLLIGINHHPCPFCPSCPAMCPFVLSAFNTHTFELPSVHYPDPSLLVFLIPHHNCWEWVFLSPRGDATSHQVILGDNESILFFGFLALVLGSGCFMVVVGIAFSRSFPQVSGLLGSGFSSLHKRLPLLSLLSLQSLVSQVLSSIPFATLINSSGTFLLGFEGYNKTPRFWVSASQAPSWASQSQSFGFHGVVVCIMSSPCHIPMWRRGSSGKSLCE
jgi:hypothetical protein